jgi:RNA polymerase sigma factor (sigma-70 family)
MNSTRQPLTTLLSAAGNGDHSARNRLWALVYAELRRMAHFALAGDGAARHLQTTELVQEAYLRLSSNGDIDWNSRGHFFGAAARAMRRICVDDARKRNALKHGGGRGIVAFSELSSGCAESVDSNGDAVTLTPALSLQGRGSDWSLADLLALDEALDRLERFDPRKAEVVMLRYFAGLSIDDTAASLGLAPRTIDNECRLARAWLYRELTGTPSPCQGEGAASPLPAGEGV